MDLHGSEDKLRDLTQLAKKNRAVNFKQLQDSIDLLNELLKLGMHKGPEYGLSAPYADGLRKTEPNVRNSERTLRFDQS